MTHSITLQTGNSSVDTSTILGRLNFAASNESSGGVSNLISSSLYAIAESSFTASNNSTSLVLATASNGSIVDRVRITSLGDFEIRPGVGRSPSLRLYGANTSNYHDFNSVFNVGVSISSVGGLPHNYFNTLGHVLRSNAALYWSSSSTNATLGPADLFLHRDQANVLALRNGLNNQSIRVYGTYTDPSNYVRLLLNCTSTQARIFPQTGGTGADNIELILNAAGNSSVIIAGATSMNSAGLTVTITESLDPLVQKITTLNTNGLTTNSSISNNTSSGGITATKEASRGDQFHVGSIDIDGEDIIDPETEEVIDHIYRPSMGMHLNNVDGFYLEKNDATVFQFNPNSDEWTVSDPPGFKQAIDLWTDDDVEFKSLSLGDQSNTEENPLGPGVLTVNSGELLFNGSPVGSSFELLSESSGVLNIAGPVYLSGIVYDSFFSPGSSGQVLTSTASGVDWKSLSEITGVDGTGSGNYLAKWADSDSITNSQIFDNGTNVGIGTLSPSGKLHVSGNLIANNGTLTASTPVLDLSQTWNNASATFVANQTNVNDTASSASSVLHRFNVGGTTVFQIEKDGTLRFGTAAGVGKINVVGLDRVNGQLLLSGTSNGVVIEGNGGLRISGFGASSLAQVRSFEDMEVGPTANNRFLRLRSNGTQPILLQSGNHAVEQYNSTNAQTLRLYRTYTDTSNYERAALFSGTYSSKPYFILAAETAGTGGVNIDLVLRPAGNGALILGPPPDGTTVGGNARGDNAIDLQLIHNPATRVASGWGSVCIGLNNSASNFYTVSIGNSNRAGGYNAIIFGTNSNCDGQDAMALGHNCISNQWYTTALGMRASSTQLGLFSWNNSHVFSTTGDSQAIKAKLANKTTGNSPIELFSDGSSVRFTIPSGKIVSFLINITGIKSDGSASCHFIRQYSIKNVGGTTSEVYAPVTVGSDFPAGCDVVLSADNTNDALKLEVIGIAGETWRWTAVIDGVEVAYGT